MTLGLVGRKVGMTRVFDENGASVLHLSIWSII
ncbi:hypothetical protein SASC598O11_000870, partial [Snodgrassella alvi SCGC AB-598-O11]